MPGDFDLKPVKITKKQETNAPRKKEDAEPKIINKEISKKIVEQRQVLNISQKQLAAMVSKPVTLISEWERGVATYDDKMRRDLEKALKIKF